MVTMKIVEKCVLIFQKFYFSRIPFLFLECCEANEGGTAVYHEAGELTSSEARAALDRSILLARCRNRLRACYRYKL